MADVEVFIAKRTTEDWVPKTRRVIDPSFKWSDCDPAYHEVCDACRDTVQALRFDATALPLDDIVFEARGDGVGISIRMLVPNRDKPEEIEWIQVWRSLLVAWEAIRMNGPDYLVRQMKDIVDQVMSHEVAESITLAGERVFDPHRPLVGSR